MWRSILSSIRSAIQAQAYASTASWRKYYAVLIAIASASAGLAAVPFRLAAISILERAVAFTAPAPQRVGGGRYLELIQQLLQL